MLCSHLEFRCWNSLLVWFIFGHWSNFPLLSRGSHKLLCWLHLNSSNDWIICSSESCIKFPIFCHLGVALITYNQHCWHALHMHCKELSSRDILQDISWLGTLCGDAFFLSLSGRTRTNALKVNKILVRSSNKYFIKSESRQCCSVDVCRLWKESFNYCATFWILKFISKIFFMPML